MIEDYCGDIRMIEDSVEGLCFRSESTSDEFYFSESALIVEQWPGFACPC